MKILYFNYLYDLYGMSIGSTRKAERLMETLRPLVGVLKIYWRKSQPKVTDARTNRRRSWFKRWLSRYLHEPKQFLSNIKYFIEEYHIVQREKPDLLIVRSAMLLFSGLLIGRLKHLPVIIEADAAGTYEIHHFHPEFYAYFGLAEWFEKKMLSLADRSICVSTAAKEHFIQMGVPASKLSVVTNGADVRFFHPDIDGDPVRRQLNLGGRISIGFSGSFHYWHGMDHLVRIIQEILHDKDQVAFVLIGTGGPMKNTLEKQLKPYVQKGQVIFTGLIPHESIPSYLAALDILLAPYPDLPLFYYSPVKIFEYMACGKAVVSSKIGQIEELITHEIDGLIYPPGDTEAMIGGIKRLICEEELRLALGRRAAKKIREAHTWTHKARDWHRIIEEVMRG
ncbi:MAG TPA: glycosyltransferase WbuB [bacterium]|nr:glycosyltransferase WbuB [bacterium]